MSLKLTLTTIKESEPIVFTIVSIFIFLYIVNVFFRIKKKLSRIHDLGTALASLNRHCELPFEVSTIVGNG